ncbi:NUDIX domain-containing protein [Georgenia subflava]|uniref:NUDIX domain-containing protein n=2 Tax=Georgenia subflava TaxID=1622177 RepID=A0A6N7EK66_9MICO|nr:NUDIX domain-containing protein [Georgenia subflava]
MDTRVACYGVVVDDGRILLAHWAGANGAGWTLPGGGMEPGETPQETAVREVLEETGFTVTLDDLLGVTNFWIPVEERQDGGGPGPLQGLRVIYRARITGGVLTAEADGSTDDARWFDLDDVAALERVSLVDEAVALFRRATGR